MSRRLSGAAGRRSSASSAGSRSSLAPSRGSKIPAAMGSENQSRLSVGRPRNTSGSFGFGFGGRPSLTGAGSGKRPLGNCNSDLGASSKQRRWSAAKQNYGSQLKDTRPINDKPYRHACVAELIEFLSKNGYPHQLTPKLLQCPPSKDVVRIFEFMVGLLIPKYHIGGKMEEEIPRMLRVLGYPFTISKSSMYSVGSPHGWPTMLAALTWLRCSIKGPLRTDTESLVFSPPDDNFDSVSNEKIAFQYFGDTYREFLSGADEFDEYDAALERQLKETGAGAQMDHLSKQNMMLHEQLEKLQNKQNPLSAAKEMLMSMNLDLQTFSSYIDNMDAHIKLLQQNGAQKITKKKKVPTATLR